MCIRDSCVADEEPLPAPCVADEEEAAVVGFDDSSDEEDFWALVGCDASSDGEEEARGGDPWPGVDAARCAAALKSEGFVVVTGATGGALAAKLGNDVENAAAQSLLRASPNALQTGSGARTIRAKVGVEELELASKGAPVLDDPSVVALRGLCPALRDFGGGAARVLGSRLGAALGGSALRVDEVKAARHGPGGCFPAHFDTTEATGRVVTGILYLADEWGPTDGGELRLYRAGGADAVDVPPRRDTLVLFSSRATLHRTLPLRRGSRPLAVLGVGIGERSPLPLLLPLLPAVLFAAAPRELRPRVHRRLAVLLRLQLLRARYLFEERLTVTADGMHVVCPALGRR